MTDAPIPPQPEQTGVSQPDVSLADVDRSDAEAPARMTRKEWLILLGIVFFVSLVIWFSTSTVWDSVFSVEETPAQRP